ncbi:hypothetical protein ACOME3_001187 [Neoechinorhynchus agilis]
MNEQMEPQQRSIVLNFEMNGNYDIYNRVIKNINLYAAKNLNVNLILAPPSVYIMKIRSILSPLIALAAQNSYKEDKGAFTGELSPLMIKDAGCEWVIIGHSSRRKIFGESNEEVWARARAARSSGLKVILCVTLTDNKDDVLFQLNGLTKDIIGNDTFMIACESQTDLSPKEADKVFYNFRKMVQDIVGFEAATKVDFIYGCNVDSRKCGKDELARNCAGYLFNGEKILFDDIYELLNVL